MDSLSDKCEAPQTKAPSPASPTAKKITRILIAAVISLAGAFLFTARIRPARMDYIEYWSSGHLFTHFANPYSPAGIFQLEKAHGFLPPKPLIMLNPPWALFLAAPLGFFGVHAGLFLWTLALAACILVSVHLLNPGSRDNPLALLFAPTIACIGSGQSSPFLLLGFALFLLFHRRRPFLAGASLLLMAIKPHLFLVFWAVLLADCIYRRRFRILAGGAAALAAASAFSMCIDIHVWRQYLAAVRTSALSHQFFPTVSSLLRLLINPRAAWLLLVPSALAVFWALWYYKRKRLVWNWTTHGMLLILVTVLTSPYGWFTDEIVLLPAIIFALNLPEKQKHAGWILLAINAVAALIYAAAGASLQSPVLIWTPVAWFAWFLYATKQTTPHSEQSSVQMADAAGR